MAWEIDYDAIDSACNTLGVAYPVRFRLQKNLRSLGEHWWMDDYHKINVKRTLSRQNANDTIWHELTHAAQTERYGPEWMEEIKTLEFAYRGFSKGKIYRNWKYQSIPFEAEAEMVVSKYGHRWVIK